MNYQSKKDQGFSIAIEKESRTANSRTTYEKGVSKRTQKEDEMLNFKFIVPWQMD
jgi:hypothetical protein